MRYVALATDHDGTPAADGRASPEPLDGTRALREAAEIGRGDGDPSETR